MSTQPPVPPGSLVLPIDQEEFKKFITGLLGKPQTLESTLRGCFELDARDVENTFHLVQQRVTQQNAATLIQFTVKLVYEDNSTVLLNSLEAFKTHAEVRPVATIGAHLSWTYLITFQDRKAPEKQQIDMSFVVAHHRVMFEDGPAFIVPMPGGGGHVFIRISHTARTWGVDLEALLTGHAKSLMKTESKFAKFINDQSGWIALACGLLFFVSSVFYGFKLTARMVQAQAATVQTSLAAVPADIQGVSQKVDLLIKSFSGSEWIAFSNMFGLQVIGSVVLALIFGIVIGVMAETVKRESFVLLSRKSQELKAAADAKLRRRWFEIAVTFVLGVVGGIVSNIIFARLVS